MNERSEALVRGFIILESLLIESLKEFQLRSIKDNDFQKELSGIKNILIIF